MTRRSLLWFATLIPAVLLAGVLAPVAQASPAVSTGGTYVALPAARVLDTRHAIGGARPGPNGTVHLRVLGVAGVPVSGVSAVALTLTATAPTAGGYVTAYPNGTTRPTASNLNFVKGQTIANGAVVPLGADGEIALFNGSAGSTQLLADVNGFYRDGPVTAPGAFSPTTPTRRLDTRKGLGGTRPGPHGTVRLDLGVADTSVLLNVTATGPTRSGYVAVYPHGSAAPGTSNLNFASGQTIANRVVVAVPADGTIDLLNGSAGSTQLVVDVLGTFAPGDPALPGSFQAVTPTRLLDTRTSGGQPAGAYPTVVQVTGAAGVPANASTVLLDVTTTGAAQAGYLAAESQYSFPTGTSWLNFTPGRSVASLLQVPTGGDAALTFVARTVDHRTVNLVVDVVGYTLSGTGSGLGSISGYVQFDNTGLPGVTALVYEGSTQVGSARTGANGIYTVAGLEPANDYTVCFDMSTVTGQPPSTKYQDECYDNYDWDGSVPPTQADQVYVDPGALTASIDAPSVEKQ